MAEVSSKFNGSGMSLARGSQDVNKWTVFFMSLLVPGTGQLRAGSQTCWVWFFAAAFCLATVVSLSPEATQAANSTLQVLVLGLLGILSAEHAKRQLEPGSAARPVPWPTTSGNRLQVTSMPRRGRQIDVRIELTVRRSTEAMWQRISDLRRFLTIDPFHQEIVVMRRQAAAGVDLVLRHNAFGHQFSRYGRILRWHEGRGYAFSDLSGRDPSQGFPHVFFVELEPATGSLEADEGAATRVTIAIRGKWTARWVPVAWGRWWVTRICREHGRLLRKAL